MRIIPTPEGATGIAVKAGYLFVIVGNYGIEAFAPGAGNPALPPPQPLFSFGGNPSEYAFYDLLVDGAGRLYAQVDFAPIVVYSNPLKHWQSPDRVIAVQPQLEGYASYPMALEPERNLLWFEVYDTMYRNPWGLAVHAARSLDSFSSAPDELTAAKNCHEPGIGGPELGMAVDRKYVMFTCELYDTTGAVLVYRNAPGRQSLVEVIGAGRGLTHPAGLTFGP